MGLDQDDQDMFAEKLTQIVDALDTIGDHLEKLIDCFEFATAEIDTGGGAIRVTKI